ncbi:MAG: menaquinone biosynthesis protein [Fimbriimonadaceae bacterium]|nr:MAG: menaquinone biosynthesis protein [Fimbriimonadaceae bacterium]
MGEFRVGCVSYVNATPLIWHFNHLGENSPVDVVYDVPSKLPALLDSGDVQAILVSSIDSILNPDRVILSDVCIGSNGPVESVRLFSRVPFDQIQTLALDASSMTSNQLAQIILKEKYNIQPKTITMPPDGESMLTVCDACILIGDIGMTAQVPGSRIMDLGEEWTDLTGLPFVWALWTANERDSKLSKLLSESYLQSLQNWESVLNLAQQRVNWPRETIDYYLTRCVRFPFDSEARDGFSKFTKFVNISISAESEPRQ